MFSANAFGPWQRENPVENNQESEEAETQVNDWININSMMICNYVFALCSNPTVSCHNTQSDYDFWKF